MNNEMTSGTSADARVPPAQEIGRNLAGEILPDPSVRLSVTGMEAVIRKYLDRSLILQGFNEQIDSDVAQGKLPNEEVPLIRESFKYVLVSGGKGLQTRPPDEQNPRRVVHRVSQEVKAQIRADMEKGVPLDHLEKKHGVLKQTLMNWKRDWKILTGGPADGGNQGQGGSNDEGQRREPGPSDGSDGSGNSSS